MGAAVFEQSALAMGCGDGSDFASQTVQYLPFDTSTYEYHPDKDVYYKSGVALGGKIQFLANGGVGNWVTSYSTAISTIAYAANVKAIPGTTLYFLWGPSATANSVDICTYNSATDTFSAVTTLTHGLANATVEFRSSGSATFMLVAWLNTQVVASGATLAKVYTTTTPLSGWTLKSTLTADATYTQLYDMQPQFISGRFAALFQKVNTAGTGFIWVGYSCATINGTWAAVTWKNTNTSPIYQSYGVNTSGDANAVVYDNSLGKYFVTADFATYTPITGAYANAIGWYYPIGNNLYRVGSNSSDLEIIQLVGAASTQLYSCKKANITSPKTRCYSPGKILFEQTIGGITCRTPRY